MNVLISSTQQWNPGDEFIRLGVMNLLQEVIPGDHNYILWNRNPDLFIDGFTKPYVKDNVWSNSFSEPNLKHIDLVVIAGSPEWTGPPLQKVYEELVKYPNVPLWVIGVGYSYPGMVLSEDEKIVLKRESTKVITRSYEVRDECNKQLGFEKAITLPCPALFCQTITQQSVKNNAVIIQGCNSRQGISKELRDNLLTLPNVDFITFYKDDFLELKELGVNSIYHFDSNYYLNILRKYEHIISTRLHGAIASLSALIPTVLVDKNNTYRLQTAQRPYGDFLPIVEFENLQSINLRLPGHIWMFKLETKDKYKEFLK